MDIGVLASILGTDATELKANLKLESDQENVPDDQLQKLLSEHIESKRREAFSNGKNEGHGWGKKEALKEAEKIIKDKYGVDGDFNSQMDALETKLKSGKDDTQTEILKEKLKLAQKELVDFKTGIERQKQDSVINNKIESIVKTHFEIPSEKLKELTIQDYKSKRKYEIAEDGKDIFLLDDTGKPLMKEGKYIAFENDAIDYFKSVFPEKQGNSTPPNVPDANGNKTTVPTGATVDELLKQLYKATTADERNAIQNRLKALEK